MTNQFNIRYLTILLIAILSIAMIVSYLVPNLATDSILFKSYVSITIVIFTELFCQFFKIMIDHVINFHKRNNAVHLEKNPIRFLIANENKLKKTFSLGFLLLLIVMLAGLWFG